MSENLESKTFKESSFEDYLPHKFEKTTDDDYAWYYADASTETHDIVFVYTLMDNALWKNTPYIKGNIRNKETGESQDFIYKYKDVSFEETNSTYTVRFAEDTFLKMNFSGDKIDSYRLNINMDGKINTLSANLDIKSLVKGFTTKNNGLYMTGIHDKNEFCGVNFSSPKTSINGSLNIKGENPLNINFDGNHGYLDQTYGNISVARKLKWNWLRASTGDSAFVGVKTVENKRFTGNLEMLCFADKNGLRIIEDFNVKESNYRSFNKMLVPNTVMFESEDLRVISNYISNHNKETFYVRDNTSVKFEFKDGQIAETEGLNEFFLNKIPRLQYPLFSFERIIKPAAIDLVYKMEKETREFFNGVESPKIQA